MRYLNTQTFQGDQAGVLPLHAAGSALDIERQGRLSREMVRALVAVGFLAISHRALGPARQIFMTLRAFRQQHDFPVIGLALIAILEDRAGHAIDLLSDLLKQTPDSDELRAFLGFALLQARRYKECIDLTAQIDKHDAQSPFREFSKILQQRIACVASPVSIGWPDVKPSVKPTQY